MPATAPDQSHPGDETSKIPAAPAEFGGPKGEEPTRYGDWESNGVCRDF